MCTCSMFIQVWAPCCRLWPLAFRMGPHHCQVLKMQCIVCQNIKYGPKQFWTDLTSYLSVSVSVLFLNVEVRERLKS